MLELLSCHAMLLRFAATESTTPPAALEGAAPLTHDEGPNMSSNILNVSCNYPSTSRHVTSYPRKIMQIPHGLLVGAAQILPRSLTASNPICSTASISDVTLERPGLHSLFEQLCMLKRLKLPC